MLVNEQDCDVLAFLSKVVKGGLDGRVFGFPVNHEEVLLAVRWLSNVLSQDQSFPDHG